MLNFVGIKFCYTFATQMRDDRADVQIKLVEENYAKIAQLVEHNLAKVGVAGSSPVFRSPLKLTVEAVNFFCPGGGIGRHATLRG